MIVTRTAASNLTLFCVGGLEQVHCCKRSHCPSALWPWWYNLQHGQLLRKQRSIPLTFFLFLTKYLTVKALTRYIIILAISGALYNIISVPPEKTNAKDTLQGAKVLCSIVPTNKSHPSYYHSFGKSPPRKCDLYLSFDLRNTLLFPPAMSENYVVFIEQPIKMDLLKIVTCKLRGKALSEGIYWDPKQETVFHLIDKRTGEVRC